MFQLLYAVILAEMVLILSLSFTTPLRKLVILCLDRIKRGRGPVMIKTIAGTVCVVLISNVYSIVMIRKRTIEAGAPTPTDQVLLATHMHETSLMGFLLFLALMIDRLHHLDREFRLMRKTINANSQKRYSSFDDFKNENPKNNKSSPSAPDNVSEIAS